MIDERNNTIKYIPLKNIAGVNNEHSDSILVFTKSDTKVYVQDQNNAEVELLDNNHAEANVLAPSGGATVDAEARSAITDILAILVAKGLMADVP